MNVKQEVWMNLFGEIIAIQRNPCGCHKDDYLIFYSERKVVSWSTRDRKHFLKIVKYKKWEKLP